MQERQWYGEAKAILPVHKFPDKDFIIYKGFKLTSFHNGKYLIEDTRSSENYGKPLTKDLSIMNLKGFIKGCDEISYKNNLSNIVSTTKRIELLYSRRKKYRRKIKEGSEIQKNEKRVRNINKNIDILADRIFMYKTRVKQFKSKYKQYE